MGEFLRASFQMPTVVFTVALGLVLVYWVIVIASGMNSDLLGGGEDAFGADVGDSGLEAGGGGPISEILETLGLTAVPPTISLSFLVLFGWFFCLVGTEFVDDRELVGIGALAAAGAVVLVSLILSSVLTGVVVRPMRRFFVPTAALERRHFVGKLCRIRTGRVSTEFGQAELVDGEGANLLVQVRSVGDNSLTAGDWALVYDYDDEHEVFLVERADPTLTPG